MGSDSGMTLDTTAFGVFGDAFVTLASSKRLPRRCR